MSARGGPAAGVRRRAAKALDGILGSRSPADVHLRQAEDGLDERDRRLLRELVLGSLRWLRRLDHVLETASGRRVAKIRRRLLAPLRIGAYQLLYLERVPAFAAVDRAVADARRRAGAPGAGFVNAVLRKVAARPRLDAWPVGGEDTATRLGIETSHPDFLVRRWLERFGVEATRRLLEASNRPRPIWLLATGEPAATAADLLRQGVETAPGSLIPTALRVVAGDPFSTDVFARGGVYAQDEASQAAALVPPPTAGELVLDAAASPGGKGFALAAFEPTVRIVSGDNALARLSRLRANQRRLGRADPTVVFDAREPSLRPVFDRVVADLPCSGTGTLSRHPELKWRLSEAEIDRLAAGGLEIVLGLAPLLRPGGVLTVVTCSLEREENEEVVAALLARRPELEPVDLERRLAPALGAHVFGPGAWRLPATPERDGFTVHALRSAGGATPPRPTD